MWESVGLAALLPTRFGAGADSLLSARRALPFRKVEKRNRRSSVTMAAVVLLGVADHRV